MKTSFVSRLYKTIEYWCSEKGFPEYVTITLVSLLFFGLATTIHELGHVIVANLLGCEATIFDLQLLTGATSVGECSNTNLIIISLAGPLTAFAVGLLLWFYEENGTPRILALILFFLSSVLQLFPIEYLDMGQAIKFGLNPIVGWIIFFAVFSVAMNLIWLEIKD